MGLPQYPVDPKTLPTWCHVECHVDSSNPFESELGPHQSRNLYTTWQGPSIYSIKWPEGWHHRLIHISIQNNKNLGKRIKKESRTRQLFLLLYLKHHFFPQGNKYAPTWPPELDPPRHPRPRVGSTRATPHLIFNGMGFREFQVWPV